jgi:hypothetical protein
MIRVICWACRAFCKYDAARMIWTCPKCLTQITVEELEKEIG